MEKLVTRAERLATVSPALPSASRFTASTLNGTAAIGDRPPEVIHHRETAETADSVSDHLAGSTGVDKRNIDRFFDSNATSTVATTTGQANFSTGTAASVLEVGRLRTRTTMDSVSANTPPPKLSGATRVTSPTSIAAEERSRAQLAAELSKVNSEMSKTTLRTAKHTIRGSHAQNASRNAPSQSSTKGGSNPPDAVSKAPRKDPIEGQQSRELKKQPQVEDDLQKLILGASYPASVGWNEHRSYLTGDCLEEASSSSRSLQDEKRAVLGTAKSGLGKPSAVQELLLIDDLLYAMAGGDGEYVQARSISGRSGEVAFTLEDNLDVSLRVSM
jgi:hypothetical protein